MASYQPLPPVYDAPQPTHELLPMGSYDTDEYYHERPSSRASSQAPLQEEASEEASANITYKGYAENIDHEGRFHHGPFRLYKRRFIGLAQLTLVNLILAWGSGTFGSIADSAAEYFDVSVDTVNWLGTAGSLAFLPAAPAAVWILNKSGPKLAMIIASALVLAGNWIRYAGTRTASFRTVMVGQVILSFAQPFVLCAPTRYSKLWFSDRGRTSATAVASLSSALGAVIGGLVGPQLAEASSKSRVRVAGAATLPARC